MQEQESTDSSDDNDDDNDDDDYSVESSVEDEALEIDVQQVHGGGGREQTRMGRGVRAGGVHQARPQAGGNREQDGRDMGGIDRGGRERGEMNPGRLDLLADLNHPPGGRVIDGVGEMGLVQRPLYAIFNHPPVLANRGCNRDPVPPQFQPLVEPKLSMLREANRDRNHGRSVPANVQVEVIDLVNDDDNDNDNDDQQQHQIVVPALPHGPRGRRREARSRQLEWARNNARERGRSLPSQRVYLERIVQPITIEQHDKTTNINGSYHHTNPNRKIMMHPGQGYLLPKPDVGDVSKIKNYNKFTDITREQLFGFLTAAMDLRAAVVPGCLIKVDSCYHRRIWTRINLLNHTYPPGFFYSRLVQIKKYVLYIKHRW